MTKSWYAVTFTDLTTNKFDADVVYATSPDAARRLFQNTQPGDTRIQMVQRVFHIVVDQSLTSQRA